MEENIKILERMLEIEKECLHYDVSQDEIQAIKNLINRNKELEEDISKMYDEEVVISIISDEFNLSRNEVLELLGESED